MGNSNTMTKDTTMSDAMTDNTTVGDAMTDTNNGSGEGSSAIVSDLGNISVDIVGVIVDVLDPSVRQVDRVVSLPGSGAIVGLLGVETGSRVVVSHGILVGVGGDLVRVDLNGMGNWVSNSMTNHAMADANTMTDANTMAKANTMTKANTMANSSKELSRGSSHKSGDRNESLRMKYSNADVFKVTMVTYMLRTAVTNWWFTPRPESL